MAPRTSSNDLIVQQARARAREQVELNAKRAVTEIVRVLPVSGRKTLLKYGREVEAAIVKEFSEAS
jgi:hypothetical protein